MYSLDVNGISWRMYAYGNNIAAQYIQYGNVIFAFTLVAYSVLQVPSSYLINEPSAHLTCLATATPQPTVRLVNSTLQSLSISWSVTSPQDVTNYMVFWWKESAEISKSVALDDTKFVIEGLLSNTAYHVVVLASGPLGRINSTTELFYTPPKQIQGNLPNGSLLLPYITPLNSYIYIQYITPFQNVVRLFGINKLCSLIF